MTDSPSSTANEEARIMYVCSPCYEQASESCGYVDRNELRIMPDGRWLCEGCHENESREDTPLWRDLPLPPEYAPTGVPAQRARPAILDRICEAWGIKLTEPAENWDMQPPLDERYTTYVLSAAELSELRSALAPRDARNVKLADELMAFHDCCTQDAAGGDGSFRVECSSGSDAQARALRAVLREAATALRQTPALPSTKLGGIDAP